MLVPLTVDRFVAIVFPVQYTTWITPVSTWTMVLLSWAPGTVGCLVDLVQFYRGELKVGKNSKVIKLQTIVFSSQENFKLPTVASANNR